MSKQLLVDLLETIGYIYETGVTAHRSKLSWPREMQNHAERQAYMRKIRLLEKSKQLQLIKEGNEVFYQITTKGRLEAIKTVILTKDQYLPDGDFCLVIFDIPEDIRKVRWAFRDLLKRAEFYQVQKSVWESDREVVEEIRELVKALKIDKYVKVYRANGER